MLTITPNEAQVKRAMRELVHIRDGAPRAMSAALNKTATGAKTDTIRVLAKIYTAKQKKIRDSITTGRKASPSNLIAKIIGSYKRPIGLIDFNAKPKAVTRRRPLGGIRIEVKRGQTKQIPHAFIAKLGGRPRVAGRKTHKRYPIEQLYGPNIPQMMDNDGAADEVMRLTQSRMEKNLDHEIDRIEKGYGG